MKRSLDTSGGEEHVYLVKRAVKRVIDEMAGLRVITISFEDSEFQFEVTIREDRDSYTNAHFSFRPDMIVRAKNTSGSPIYSEKTWTKITDSSAIVFEAETDPKNFFNNAIKVEAYKKIKGDSYGRFGYSFVLVCWEDAKLPKNIEPFDEVWRFSKTEAQ